MPFQGRVDSTDAEIESCRMTSSVLVNVRNRLAVEQPLVLRLLDLAGEQKEKRLRDWLPPTPTRTHNRPIARAGNPAASSSDVSDWEP